MTDWLTRALAVTPSLAPVSETIKTSETARSGDADASFGGFGGFGAGRPYPARGANGLAEVANPCAPPTDGPGRWREALLALSCDLDPCCGFRPGAWAHVRDNALDFLDRHGDEAFRLGWAAEELFGVHPIVGVIRADCCGALMLSAAGRVLAVEAGLIRYANGLAFRRSLGSASVPVWLHPGARP